MATPLTKVTNHLDWGKVDWTLSNDEIAKVYRVSITLVRTARIVAAKNIKLQVKP